MSSEPTKARWTNPPSGQYPRATEEAWWYARAGGIDFCVEHRDAEGRCLRTDIFRLRPSELRRALKVKL